MIFFLFFILFRVLQQGKQDYTEAPEILGGQSLVEGERSFSAQDLANAIQVTGIEP